MAARFALLETRKAGELASLIERLGGTTRCVPSVREITRHADFDPVLRRLASGAFDLVVVLTGAAFDALLAEADRRGLGDPVLSALGHIRIACRGPKPLLALRRRALTAEVTTPKPHTSEDLLRALQTLDLAQTSVLVLHYGETSETVSAALRARGARVEDLRLYDWALPEDVTPLRTLVADAVSGRVDAMLFTSQVQLRHLLQVANDMGLVAQLTRALCDDVVVGSVGPVCTRALRESGIVPDVMPASPNAASLVQALADYVAMLDEVRPAKR